MIRVHEMVFVIQYVTFLSPDLLQDFYQLIHSLASFVLHVGSNLKFLSSYSDNSIQVQSQFIKAISNFLFSRSSVFIDEFVQHIY